MPCKRGDVVLVLSDLDREIDKRIGRYPNMSAVDQALRTILEL